MPFEAFLSETHSRPPRASTFGFLASLAMHGPPITVFVTTWLTHAMLIGSTAVYEPDANPTRGIVYIPVSLYGQGAGGGNDPASPLAVNSGSRQRAGVLGRSGRAGRRGLMAPREVKQLSSKTVWNDPFMLGSYASNSARGALGHTTGGGDDHAGTGIGSGNAGNGSGGGALNGGVGNGMLAATMVERPKDRSTEKKLGRGDTNKRGTSNGEDDAEIGSDLDFLLEDGRPVKAAYISQDTAAYYRLEDPMPTLHAYWTPGRREWAMLFRICVSTEGAVSNVTVLKSGADDVDQVFASTMRTWRYRPRVIDGAPRPFCHPIRIIYARQL